VGIQDKSLSVNQTRGRIDLMVGGATSGKPSREGDRQTFGRVYIGTNGCGIYAGDSN
jgi:hypothetical protein